MAGIGVFYLKLHFFTLGQILMELAMKGAKSEIFTYKLNRHIN
jgi:hypothetical protein